MPSTATPTPRRCAWAGSWPPATDGRALMATMTRPVARRAIRERGLDPTSPVRHFDYLLVSAVVAIAALGLVMIYSTTHHKVVGDELYYVKRQALFLLLGGAAMAVTIAV